MYRTLTGSYFVGTTKKKTQMDDALAGCVAGLIAASVTHPLDTLKVRKMTGLRLGVGEFTRGLYRGFPCVAVFSTIGNGVYFGAYEWSRVRLQAAGWGDISGPFLGGVAANTLTLVVWVPQDVIKERQQVFSTPQYRSVISSAGALLQEGGVFGLYRGFGWSFLTYTPLCALYFVFYEAYKKQAAEYLSVSEDALSMPIYAVGGALCGGAAGALTTPLDVLKVTMQVGHRDVRSALQHPFRGLGYRVATIAPTYALTISLWEECRKVVSQA